ncbi:MAG: stage III sporulation protein AB [Clostridiales bacterium]|jgi:stage III sporulation protein AB|nr:stage III sporulation protein AB [Clostridiales bacterium]
MILKIVGAVLVCASSALLGLYFARLDSFRVSDLNEWKKALLILRSQIAFAAVPLPEATLCAASRVGDPVSKTLASFAERLSNRDSADIYGTWRKTLRENTSGSYLKQEDWEWLGNFGKTLGFLDRAMQLNSIDLTISYIDGKTEILSVQGEKNRRMFGSLGILGGMMTVVILL